MGGILDTSARGLLAMCQIAIDGQATKHQGYTGRPIMPGDRLPWLARQQGSKAVQTHKATSRLASCENS
eukprot:5009394-Karenia_brevis.AAC.1